MKQIQWLKPDDYHIRSACGQFSVCRMSTPFAIWYIAWRKSKLDDFAREIGATRVPVAAPDSERSNAIKAMQELCEAEA